MCELGKREWVSTAELAVCLQQPSVQQNRGLLFSCAGAGGGGPGGGAPAPADALNTDNALKDQRTVAREVYSALGVPKRTSGMLERKGRITAN